MPRVMGATTICGVGLTIGIGSVTPPGMRLPFQGFGESAWQRVFVALRGNQDGDGAPLIAQAVQCRQTAVPRTRGDDLVVAAEAANEVTLQSRQCRFVIVDEQ